MTTIEVEKAKVKAGIGIAVSILVGLITLSITVGSYLGDWKEWRRTTTQDVQDLKSAVFPHMAARQK